jgi:hypothetical protein
MAQLTSEVFNENGLILIILIQALFGYLRYKFLPTKIESIAPYIYSSL